MFWIIKLLNLKIYKEYILWIDIILIDNIEFIAFNFIFISHNINYMLAKIHQSNMDSKNNKIYSFFFKKSLYLLLKNYKAAMRNAYFWD